jgi:hypothetical protein
MHGGLQADSYIINDEPGLCCDRHGVTTSMNVQTFMTAAHTHFHAGHESRGHKSMTDSSTVKWSNSMWVMQTEDLFQ